MDKEIKNNKEIKNDLFDSSIDVAETTIGDLVHAITEIASHYGKSEKESYHIAQETLADVLSRQDIDYTKEEFNLD